MHDRRERQPNPPPLAPHQHPQTTRTPLLCHGWSNLKTNRLSCLGVSVKPPPRRHDTTPEDVFRVQASSAAATRRDAAAKDLVDAQKCLTEGELRALMGSDLRLSRWTPTSGALLVLAACAGSARGVYDSQSV